MYYEKDDHFYSRCGNGDLLVGCSGNNGSSNHGGSGDGSTYSSAVEVLETVYGVYSEDQSSPSAAAIRST